jgi:thiamine-monophosphate kinase
MKTAERALLRWVRREAAPNIRPALHAPPSPSAGKARSASRIRIGIGDDAAVLSIGAGFEAVVTTDQVIAGVHFLPARDLPADVGYRLAGRGLSDLAAMGSEPLALFLSLAIPRATPDSWIRSFFRGFTRAAREAGAQLAGGDLSESPVSATRAARTSGTNRGGAIHGTVTALGRVPAGRALLRATARPGDRIFVSGVPGLAALGRALVHGGRRPTTPAERRAVARHRHPRARVGLGLELQRARIAGAAIDISDGLLLDLQHVCDESGVGARLDLAAIPRPPVRALPGAADGLDLALGGGDDYELLFCVRPARVAAARALSTPRLQLTEIGEIVSRPGLWATVSSGRIRRLAARGWEYFK